MIDRSVDGRDIGGFFSTINREISVSTNTTTMIPTKLIYLSSARLPTEKANGYQTIKMTEAFAQTGIQTTLVHPRRVQPDALKNTDLYDFYNVIPCFETEQLSCLDWHFLLRLPSERPWFFAKSASYALHVFYYSRRWWKDEEAVLFSRDAFILSPLLQLRQFVKARLVFEVHKLLGEKRMSRIVHLLQHLDRIIVVTEGMKQAFVQAGIQAEKVRVIPNGVDLGQFQIQDTQTECRHRLGLPCQRAIIGYVGRFQNAMNMEKGIPELIQAMRYLIDTYPDNPPLLLCVGGPMECVPGYEKIAEKHSVPKEHIQFVDRVVTNEVPYWMKACDVVTIPWTWNQFSAYHTSPIKLFEYMAVGTPIVSSNLPSLCEILVDGENALLVAPGDVKDLACGLTKLLDDPILRTQLAQSASEAVQRYTWAGRAREILNGLSDQA